MIQATRSDRYVFAILAAVVVAILWMFVMARIAESFYPLMRLRGVKASASGDGPLLFNLAGWIIAIFQGCFVATWIANKNRMVVCGVVVAILCYPLWKNVISAPHPNWFVVGCFLGVPLAAVGGWQLARYLFGPKKQAEGFHAKT